VGIAAVSDGRFIDEERGILSGEAAQQQSGLPQPFENRSEVIPGDPTYYDQPVVKQPVWIWSVPAYLYTGGVAGAAMTLGAVAQIAGGWHLRPLVHRCRWMGAAGGMLSTVFLIHDLGRPERFLYMLRVFRPTSPMSVGSWVLTFFASFAGAAALFSRSGGFPGAVGNLAGVAAGLLGMPLASYTAVLLSNSAVPVWQESRRGMPFLFIGSGIAAAAAILDSMPLREREERVVNTFAIVGGLMELAGMVAVEREAGAVERVGRPFQHGVSGALWQAAKIFSATSLAVSLVPAKHRTTRRIGGALGTLASLCIRFGIFHAGKQSAADPRATFHQQRARIS
jgi:formate-dependent nitrite reductase membrane component NrfD